jgi:hypothetical protein
MGESVREKAAGLQATFSRRITDRQLHPRMLKAFLELEAAIRESQLY